MKQISDTEKQNRDKLFQLMQENPDLPVIPFVDGEVVAGDDFGSWMGSWGAARVDEFVYPPQDYEPVIFKSDNDVYDTLEKCLPEAEFNALPETEAECRPIYDALPWTKAIIVYIGMPENWDRYGRLEITSDGDF